MDAQGIRERLEHSRHLLAQKHYGTGMGWSELMAMVDKELFMLEDLRKTRPMLRLKIDALVSGWVEYRTWLEEHNE